jgi:hypothetical protein
MLHLPAKAPHYTFRRYQVPSFAMRTPHCDGCITGTECGDLINKNCGLESFTRYRADNLKIVHLLRLRYSFTVDRNQALLLAELS